MQNAPLFQPRAGRIARWTLGLLAVVAVLIAGFWIFRDALPARATDSPPTDVSLGAYRAEANPAEVVAFCGACHASPDPSAFPKASWPEQVAQGYRFFAKSGMEMEPPSEASVTRYFQNRALESLPVLVRSEPTTKLPFRLLPKGISSGHTTGNPAIANVRLLKLSGDERPQIVACDMLSGLVLATNSRGESRVLSNSARHPAHAEAADLNRDGITDLLVADLGMPMPSDDRKGAVLWLKGKSDGTFDTITLASGLGRVADVQAADFDGDGDLDLVVAEFGWREVGSVLYMENRSRPDAPPEFATTTLDARHGAIHVPVVDLDGDGKLDFVALLSQEHEAVVAFLNRGPGKFEKKMLYQAPHPAFGVSGIQLVDLDGDRDLDLLLSNGDVFDTALLRPDNGVQWLENRGNLTFEPHRLAALYGTHRAQAADLDGDGDMDVVASAFLPDSLADRPGVAEDLESIIVLEQTSPGVFVRHPLEVGKCHHATLDLGDLDGDGRIDIIAGEFVNFELEGPKSTTPSAHRDWVTVWQSLP